MEGPREAVVRALMTTVLPPGCLLIGLLVLLPILSLKLLYWVLGGC